MLIQKCLGCYSHPFSELAPHFPTKAPSLHACSSFSCPILSIISGSHFPFFQILSFLSFLILSPHFPSVFFLSSLLILYILAFLHHPFLYSCHQPPSKCLHSPPLFQLFHVLLCQKSQTLNSSSSQSLPLPLSACYPLGNCCCSQQWVRG